MITDHVGHHFYPDEMWFRVIGRLCIPIWFFLIGYARTTEVPKSLWIAGVIVTLSAIISGQFLLPLNILFAIVIARFCRQSLVNRSFYSADGLRGMYLVLLFSTFPSAVLFEYGTSAMLLVLVGYMVRNKDEISQKIEPQYLRIFAGVVFFSFFIIQGIGLPSVSASQALSMMAGFGVVGLILWNFKPVEYKNAPRHMAPSIIKLLQFTGRRTLEIYVVHLVLFRGISMYLYPDKYSFMQWDYVPSSVISMFM